MPKTPTIPEIIADFEREIARAPRFCSVDRSLLQRLIDDHRRLEEQLVFAAGCIGVEPEGLSWPGGFPGCLRESA